MAELEPEKNDRKFSIFLTILLALTLALSVVVFAFSNDFFSNNESNNLPTYTTTFSNVTPKEAYEIINTTENLTVIDCREGCNICQFNRGHLPGATMNINPATLYQVEGDYNSTTDILVYSVDGKVGAEFCLDLTGHVYGKIYNLAGGYNAWAAAKYPTK
jgi:rhodanese-related sulfurtransferase